MVILALNLDSLSGFCRFLPKEPSRQVAGMRRQERSAPGLRLLSRPRFRPSRRVVVRVCLWVWMVVRFVSQISTEPRTGHTREPDPTPLPDTRAQAHNHTQNSNTRTQPRDTSRVCEVRLCDPCARALVCPVWVPCPVPAPPGVFLPVRPCVPCVSRVCRLCPGSPRCLFTGIRYPKSCQT